MAKPARNPRRRWVAGLIIALFFVAVVGAAAIGWWYARESPPHQGPILLVSVDGVPATALSAYGAQGTATPAIDALATESVVFERAYTHSPQSLPAHASLLTGRLPFDHGVRDDVGFTLATDAETLAELLRNRGFATGAAVSSLLLQPRTGISQGFTFFDDEPPAADHEVAPIERNGVETAEAAERWMSTQSGQRYFLFVQVPARDADAALLRLSTALKERGLYDGATIFFVGDRGDAGSGLSLDDRALRVPFMIKQPDGQGGHRRVAAPVQNVDVAPTILDLVRAPVPDSLPGRSLRRVLDDDVVLPVPTIYAESLVAHFRFGGSPLYALAGGRFRFLRGSGEDLIPLDVDEESGAGESAEAARLRATLDGILASSRIPAPSPIPASEEDRYALLGYLGTDGLTASSDVTLDASSQRALVEELRSAAMLIGQKKYTAGVRALQALVRAHPSLAMVHHQLAVVLARTGRLEEAVGEFARVRELQPESSAAARALADALLHAGQVEGARQQSIVAVALAENEGPAALSAAHETAARAALADRDAEAARQHAVAAQDADPLVPMPEFVQGRLAYDQGRYEEAVAAFQEAAERLATNGRVLADLHLLLGESLARLDRSTEAEAQFREELRAFPRSTQAFVSLAMLYAGANKGEEVEDVLNDLVAATPTPETYGVAARLWTALGDPSRAEALRSDARARFRGDPSLALLGRGPR
jgi:Flp pilus assembly protein TadD